MNTCKYQSCREPASTAGWCDMHYTRNRRAKVARIQARNAQKNPPPLMDWHSVYIVGCHEFEPVKIGRSRDIIKRMETFQTGCPYQLKLYGAVFGPKEVIVWLECLAHNKLDEFGYRLRGEFKGEWFDLDPNDAVSLVEKCAAVENLPVMSLRDYVRAAQVEYESVSPQWVDRCRALHFMAHGFSD